MENKISPNNFDLIRLLAASEVAALHVLSYLAPVIYRSRSGGWGVIVTLLNFFPGVPIFFFISGFLISRSYERTISTRLYATNRCLRIYPALHVCVLINLIMVWATGYFTVVDAHFGGIALLYLAKTTIVQFYNPQFMRHFGDGVLNGSLWTVCVELQFYVLIPILYKLLSTRGARRFDVALVCLIIFSIGINRVLYGTAAFFGHSDYWKLLRVSFLPWLYMFLTGVMVQRHFSKVASVLTKNLLWPVGGLYLAYAVLMRHIGFSFHNDISPLLFFPLSAVVMSAAYTAPTLAKKLLRGNDFSYGIYIYHVPIMDTLLYLGLKGSLWDCVATAVLTACFAGASWYLVEKPSLRKKRQSIHPVTAFGATVAATEFGKESAGQ